VLGSTFDRMGYRAHFDVPMKVEYIRVTRVMGGNWGSSSSPLNSEK